MPFERVNYQYRNHDSKYDDVVIALDKLNCLQLYAMEQDSNSDE
jgi:hypothetical protein